MSTGKNCQREHYAPRSAAVMLMRSDLSDLDKVALLVFNAAVLQLLAMLFTVIAVADYTNSFTSVVNQRET